MQTKGAVPVSIVNLDLLYDRNWFGRWMTMEMKQPDNVIVHVAVGRTTAQTDVVRPTEARFQSNSVSPNTILLPERAYGAYEAVAARLSNGPPGGDLPLFVAPIGETRAVVDGVTTEQVRTTTRINPRDALCPDGDPDAADSRGSLGRSRATAATGPARRQHLRRALGRQPVIPGKAVYNLGRPSPGTP